MVTAEPPNERIPVISADSSTVVGAEIVNPNSWPTDDAKDIVRSCLAEFSVLHDYVGQIVGKSKEPERLVTKFD